MTCAVKKQSVATVAISSASLAEAGPASAPLPVSNGSTWIETLAIRPSFSTNGVGCSSASAATAALAGALGSRIWPISTKSAAIRVQRSKVRDDVMPKRLPFGCARTKKPPSAAAGNAYWRPCFSPIDLNIR